MENAYSVEPTRTFEVDQLPVGVFASNREMGLAAAEEARAVLEGVLAENEFANLVLATGNSQLTFLYALGSIPGIEWHRVRVFHMDEYVGVGEEHPASFHRFLCEHIVDKVRPAVFYPISGDARPVRQTCEDYAALLQRYPADLVALGFGENGHLAFNDPPQALFDDPEFVKVVDLAEASRMQQVGEGHFASLELVPRQAITMTIPALLAAKRILAIVPEERKAEAVRACLQEPVSEERPGSILRQIDHAKLYLDPDSASLLFDE